MGFLQHTLLSSSDNCPSVSQPLLFPPHHRSTSSPLHSPSPPSPPSHLPSLKVQSLSVSFSRPLLLEAESAMATQELMFCEWSEGRKRMVC